MSDLKSVYPIKKSPETETIFPKVEGNKGESGFNSEQSPESHETLPNENFIDPAQSSEWNKATPEVGGSEGTGEESGGENLTINEPFITALGETGSNDLKDHIVGNKKPLGEPNGEARALIDMINNQNL